MIGTDEHRNSRSCSGTPTQGDDPVPQPVFQHPAGSGEGHRYSPAPMPHPPAQGEDPFQMDIAAEHHGAINLNDDIAQVQMPARQNAAPPPIPNVQGGAGPLSQESRQFQWQLPPAVPNLPPARPPA